MNDIRDQSARIGVQPRSLRGDNGAEFARRLLGRWACLNKVEWDVSRPGKPTDNAEIEAYNCRAGQECLNASGFLSMDDAKALIDTWKPIAPKPGRILCPETRRRANALPT